MSRKSHQKDSCISTGVTLRSTAHKRKRGFQKYSGTIRVEANLYQAFVIPEFFPDDESYLNASESSNDNNNIPKLLYSPRLFDEINSYYTAYQQVFSQSNDHSLHKVNLGDAAEIVSKTENKNSNFDTSFKELLNINPNVDEGYSPERKTSKSTARLSKNKVTSFPKKNVKLSSYINSSENVFSKSKNSKSVKLKNLSKQEYVENEKVTVQNKTNASINVSTIATTVTASENQLINQVIRNQEETKKNPLAETTRYFDFLTNNNRFIYPKNELEKPISASLFLSCLNNVLKNFQTLFCSIDLSNVYETLYKSVNDNLKVIITKNKNAQSKDVWNMRKLVHHLIYKHVLDIHNNSSNILMREKTSQLSNTNTNLNPIDPETTLLLYIRACAKRQRISKSCRDFENTCSRETFCTPNLARNTSNLRVSNLESISDIVNTHDKFGTQQCETMDSYDEKQTCFSNNMSIKSDGLCTFSDLCVQYDELYSRVKIVACWKQAVSNIYRLQNNKRVPLVVAKKVFDQSDALVDICDISEERNRLKSDIESCETFKNILSSSYPTIFNNAKSFNDDNKIFDINLLKPYLQSYNDLVFSIDEGEMLIKYLESAASWQKMIANAIHGKDLDHCKDLVDTYDESNFKLDIGNLKNLREDVEASQWLDRLQRILESRKLFTLSQIQDFLDPSNLRFLIRFHDQKEIGEFIKYCSLAYTWLKKSVLPPFSCICNISDYNDLYNAYKLIVDGLKTYYSVVDPSLINSLIDSCVPNPFPGNQKTSSMTVTELDSPSKLINSNDVKNSSSQTKEYASASSRISNHSNKIRMTEEQLSDFCNSYQLFKMSFPTFHVFDDFRQRLVKWKKKLKRAFSNHNSILLPEAQTMLKEGIYLSEYIDIDICLMELEEVVRRHELWIIQTDEFLNHVRFVLSETLVARASNYLPIKLFDTLQLEQPNEKNSEILEHSKSVDLLIIGKDENMTKNILCEQSNQESASTFTLYPSNYFHEIINLLEGPPNGIKPCLDDLSRLLAQHSENLILDCERQKLLKQLQSHADRWKRRVKDCLRLKNTVSHITDSLKFQLLLEAKYFCVDVQSEQLLAKSFYLKLWRTKVFNLIFPVQEVDLLDIIRLPTTKKFYEMLSTTKSLLESALESEDTCSKVYDTAHASSLQKVIESKDLEDIIYSKVAFGNTTDILKFLTNQIPENFIPKGLELYRSKWYKKYDKLCSEKLPKNDWHKLLEDLRSMKNMQLNSLCEKVSQNLIEADELENNILKVFESTSSIDLIALQQFASFINKCPIEIDCWKKIGYPLLCMLEELEKNANSYLNRKLPLDEFSNAKNFLLSIPSILNRSTSNFNIRFRINEKSLIYVTELKNKIQKCDEWLSQMSKYSQLSLNLQSWTDFVYIGKFLNISIPEFNSVAESVLLSKQWIQLLHSFKNSNTSKIEIHIVKSFIDCSEPILRSQDIYYTDLQKELHDMFSNLIPKTISVLNAADNYDFSRALNRKCFTDHPDINQFLVDIITNLRNLIQCLSNLNLISFDFLARKLNYELTKYKLILHTTFTLNCCLPHPGCPRRSLKLANCANLGPCNYLVPINVAQKLLKDMEEHNSLLQSNDLNDIKSEPLLNSQLNEIECYFPSISKNLSENDLSKIILIPDSNAINANILQELSEKIDASTQQSQKLNKFIFEHLLNAESMLESKWNFPSLDTSFWEIWALSSNSDFTIGKNMREFNCPSEKLKTIWQKRWSLWIDQKTNAQASREFPKQKVTRSNLYIKLTETTFTSELCNNSYIDIPLRQILSKPVLNIFCANFKCPWNTRCSLDLSKFDVKNESSLQFLWPIVLECDQHASEYLSEWEEIKNLYKQQNFKQLVQVTNPSIINALTLLKSIDLECEYIGIQQSYQILSETILIELLWLSVFRSIYKDPLLDIVNPSIQEFEESLKIEVNSKSLTKLYEHCELLPLQTSFKLGILSKLYDRLITHLYLLETALCIPMGALMITVLATPSCMYENELTPVISNSLHKALFGTDLEFNNQFSQQLNRIDSLRKVINSIQLKYSKSFDIFNVHELTLYKCQIISTILEYTTEMCTVCGCFDVCNQTNFMTCTDCLQKFHISCVNPGFDLDNLNFSFSCFLCLMRRSEFDVSFISNLPFYQSNFSNDYKLSDKNLKVQDYSVGTNDIEKAYLDSFKPSSCEHNLRLIEHAAKIFKPSFSILLSTSDLDLLQIQHESYNSMTIAISTVIVWILDVAFIIYGTQNNMTYDSQKMDETEIDFKRKPVNSTSNLICSRKKSKSISKQTANCKFFETVDIKLNQTSSNVLINNSSKSNIQIMSNRQSAELSNSATKTTNLGCFKFGNFKLPRLCATVNWNDIIQILNSNSNILYKSSIPCESLLTIAKQLRHCCKSISGKPFDSLYDANQIVHFYLPFDQSIQIPYSRLLPSSNCLNDLKFLILRASFIRLSSLPFLNMLKTVYLNLLEWDSFLKYLKLTYFEGRSTSLGCNENLSTSCIKSDKIVEEVTSLEGLKVNVSSIYHPYQSLIESLVNKHFSISLNNVSINFLKNNLFKSPTHIQILDGIKNIETLIQFWFYNIYITSRECSLTDSIELYSCIEPCIDSQVIKDLSKCFILNKWLETNYTKKSNVSTSLMNIYHLLRNSYLIQRQWCLLRNKTLLNIDFDCLRQLNQNFNFTGLLKSITEDILQDRVDSICNFIPHDFNQLYSYIDECITLTPFSFSSQIETSCNKCISYVLRPYNSQDLLTCKFMSNEEIYKFAQKNIVNEVDLKPIAVFDMLNHEQCYHVHLTKEQLKILNQLKIRFFTCVHIQQCIWGVVWFLNNLTFENLNEPTRSALEILTKQTLSNKLSFSAIQELHDCIQQHNLKELDQQSEFISKYREILLISQALDSYIKKKTLITIEVYYHVSNIMQQNSHIWFDQISEWFDETTRLVTKWFNDTTNIIQHPVKDPCGTLSESLALKRSCKTIPVDLTKTRAFIDLRNFIRDLRRQEYFNTSNNESKTPNTAPSLTNNLYNSWGSDLINTIYTQSSSTSLHNTYPLNSYPYPSGSQDIVCGKPTAAVDVQIHPNYHPFSLFTIPSSFSQTQSQLLNSGDAIYNQSTASPTK